MVQKPLFDEIGICATCRACRHQLQNQIYMKLSTLSCEDNFFCKICLLRMINVIFQFVFLKRTINPDFSVFEGWWIEKKGTKSIKNPSWRYLWYDIIHTQHSIDNGAFFYVNRSNIIPSCKYLYLINTFKIAHWKKNTCF